ncbi:hypothetical protein FSP39_008750 [Pinctada imbricata]|uniref:Transmembrane protein 170A n=1 Tax=Pinctada imbricata TaxID=66713 RepID=A0AA88XK41_PINIB|nr:hypothetical protein FSP39_008750 [Pinctada imbricata]
MTTLKTKTLKICGYLTPRVSSHFSEILFSVLSSFRLYNVTFPFDIITEIWYQVFVWALISSVLVHLVAALIAFCQLRKHRLGRWVPIALVTMGFLSPLTGGVCTSAAIAFVYRGSDFEMKPFFALCWGVGQTIILIFVSFTRVLASL